MSVIENRSNTRDEVPFIHDISDTNPHVGSIIDTARYPSGVTFVGYASGLNAAEIYTFSLAQSEDSGMSGAINVATSQLTSPITDLNRESGNPRLNDTEGQFLNAVGITSTQRFIQLTGTATVNGTQGDVVVLVREAIDFKPVENNEVTV